MESLYLLIPLSLVIVAIAVWFFFRASDTGQFDDLVSPGHSILMDDDRPAPRPTDATSGPAASAGTHTRTQTPSRD